MLILFSFSARSADDKGELPEAIIKAENVLKVQSTKPKLDIKLDQDKEVLESLKVEREIFYKKPFGWEKQPQDSMPETVGSIQVIIPLSHMIRGDQVCIFYPSLELKNIYKVPDEKKSKKLGQWEMVIADDSGQTFREYSGLGLPPDMIVFDGRDKNGNVLEVGYSYSTILKYSDMSGDMHTSVGNPFIIDGLYHQEKDGYYISLDFKKLYKTPPTMFVREFSDKGKDLLQEAADIIKRAHYEYPVKVVVYSKNTEIADVTAKEISARLAVLLIRLPQDISSWGQSSEKSLERVEIIITNQ